MAEDGAKKMEEAKGCLEKIEKTKNCLAALNTLRQHIAELKALGMEGIEKQYAESSFAHAGRMRNCLNNLFFKLQESLESKEAPEINRKNSRGIKP